MKDNLKYIYIYIYLYDPRVTVLTLLNYTTRFYFAILILKVMHTQVFVLSNSLLTEVPLFQGFRMIIYIM